MRIPPSRLFAIALLVATAACQEQPSSATAPLAAEPLLTRDRAAGAPVVHITSPTRGETVASGTGQAGAGTLTNGSAFAITIETVTSGPNVAAHESTEIRNTALLGQPNPNFPGLTIEVDADLVKPDGGIIPAHTNLANLFNILGSDDSPGAGVTIWAGWHVLESLGPKVEHLTISASVRDAQGHVGSDVVVVKVDQHPRAPGQALTPPPVPVTGDSIDDATGPRVEVVGPREHSSLAIGTPTASALTFFQVNAVDRSGAGIGLSENGGADATQPIGLIRDRSQIAKAGPNRNVPGFEFRLDVALRQPNGNIVPAGRNLAPLFDIAGSAREKRRGHHVVSTLDWVIGGSLILPAGKSTITVRARVTDSAGKSGSATRVFGVSPVPDGQSLTPAP